MFFKKIILIFFAFFILIPYSNAELKIDITSGYTEPTPIGINNFIGIIEEEKTLGNQRGLERSYKVLLTNIKRSTLK